MGWVCGRMTSVTSSEDLADAFDAVMGARASAAAPSFNVAPTQLVRVVVTDADEQRTLTALRWGLVPYFARDTLGAARLINARSEEAHTKPSFRDAFARRRCLVPMDGFYEWEKLPGRATQPWYFHADRPLGVAGLWERWKDPNDPAAPALVTFTVLTAAAPEDMASVHDRTPVVLQPSLWSTWLDRQLDDPEEVRALLVGNAPPSLARHRVSPAVNKVTNDAPELIDPAAPTTLW